jgi:hypothetical protein
VDCPSTKVIPQDDVAVSALDAAGNNTVDMSQSDKVQKGKFILFKPICFCLLYHANLSIFFVIPTTPELTKTKETVDSPSAEVIAQEQAAVSASDGAGTTTVDTLQSDKIDEGTLVVCKPICFCLLYHANLIIFSVLS